LRASKQRLCARAREGAGARDWRATIRAGQRRITAPNDLTGRFRISTWSDAEMWDRQQGYIAAVFASNDAREGATAFAEKRKPIWTGT